MNLQITDREGEISVRELAEHFARILETSPKLQGRFGAVVAADVDFQRHLKKDTKIAFLWFAIGMRHCDRLVRVWKAEAPKGEFVPIVVKPPNGEGL